MAAVAVVAVAVVEADKIVDGLLAADVVKVLEAVVVVAFVVVVLRNTVDPHDYTPL